MSALGQLCFLLTAFFALGSSKPTPSLIVPTVLRQLFRPRYSPSLSQTTLVRPDLQASNPRSISTNSISTGTAPVRNSGSSSRRPVSRMDRSPSTRRPASGIHEIRHPPNVSHYTFFTWAHSLNGPFCCQVVHDKFTYGEYADGGLAYSIADSQVLESVDTNGFITKARIGKWALPSFRVTRLKSFLAASKQTSLGTQLRLCARTDLQGLPQQDWRALWPFERIDDLPSASTSPFRASNTPEQRGHD